MLGVRNTPCEQNPASRHTQENNLTKVWFFYWFHFQRLNNFLVGFRSWPLHWGKEWPSAEYRFCGVHLQREPEKRCGWRDVASLRALGGLLKPVMVRYYIMFEKRIIRILIETYIMAIQQRYKWRHGIMASWPRERLLIKHKHFCPE